ncbi:hypothetical protein B0H13DRAFT_1022691 [Mycena leptocephala]|nr:hypothetical protein B0H13DRAFT_1022691 [Mycena leptocephala]
MRGFVAFWFGVGVARMRRACAFSTGTCVCLYICRSSHPIRSFAFLFLCFLSFLLSFYPSLPSTSRVFLGGLFGFGFGFRHRPTYGYRSCQLARRRAPATVRVSATVSSIVAMCAISSSSFPIPFFGGGRRSRDRSGDDVGFSLSSLVSRLSMIFRPFLSGFFFLERTPDFRIVYATLALARALSAYLIPFSTIGGFDFLWPFFLGAGNAFSEAEAVVSVSDGGMIGTGVGVALD